MENQTHHKTWHHKHSEGLSPAQRIADRVASIIGSWTFIIVQTCIVTLWVSINIIAFLWHWDPYPFILLNLLFSTQAAYAAPIIMMAQNRQNQRDREQALADYKTDLEAKVEIEALQKQLTHIESNKLDKIIEMLKERR